MFAQGAGPAGSDVQPSREQGGEGEGAQSKHFFDDIKSDQKLIQIIVLNRRQKLGTDRQTF